MNARISFDLTSKPIGIIITLGLNTRYKWFEYTFTNVKHPTWKTRTIKLNITILKTDLEIYLRHEPNSL